MNASQRNDGVRSGGERGKVDEICMELIREAVSTVAIWHSVTIMSFQPIYGLIYPGLFPYASTCDRVTVTLVLQADGQMRKQTLVMNDKIIFNWIRKGWYVQHNRSKIDRRPTAVIMIKNRHDYWSNNLLKRHGSLTEGGTLRSGLHC